MNAWDAPRRGTLRAFAARRPPSGPLENGGILGEARLQRAGEDLEAELLPRDGLAVEVDLHGRVSLQLHPGQAGGDRMSPQRHLALLEQLAQRGPTLSPRHVRKDSDVQQPVIDPGLRTEDVPSS